MHSSLPKKRKNLRETSGNFPTFPTSEGGNGRDLHLRWESESMPRQSWTGGVIRWLIVLLLTSETPFICKTKKTNPEKDAHICFFWCFLFGMLKQHERAVSFVKPCERRWNNDSFWRHLQDGRYEEIRKGHLRVSRSPRRQTSRDVGRTVTSGGRWRVWGAWISKPMGHRRQKMAKNDAKDGHFNQSLVPTSATEISVANTCTEIFRLPGSGSWIEMIVHSSAQCRWKKRFLPSGKRRVGIDMNHIWIWYE